MPAPKRPSEPVLGSARAVLLGTQATAEAGGMSGHGNGGAALPSAPEACPAPTRKLWGTRRLASRPGGRLSGGPLRETAFRSDGLHIPTVGRETHLPNSTCPSRGIPCPSQPHAGAGPGSSGPANAQLTHRRWGDVRSGSSALPLRRQRKGSGKRRFGAASGSARNDYFFADRFKYVMPVIVSSGRICAKSLSSNTTTDVRPTAT